MIGKTTVGTGHGAKKTDFGIKDFSSFNSPTKESSSALPPPGLLRRTVGRTAAGTGSGARAALPNESARLKVPPKKNPRRIKTKTICSDVKKENYCKLKSN
jgi:hypothetical protein